LLNYHSNLSTPPSRLLSISLNTYYHSVSVAFAADDYQTGVSLNSTGLTSSKNESSISVMYSSWCLPRCFRLLSAAAIAAPLCILCVSQVQDSPSLHQFQPMDIEPSSEKRSSCGAPLPSKGTFVEENKERKPRATGFVLRAGWSNDS